MYEMSKVLVVGDVHGDLNQLMVPLIEFLTHEEKYRKLIYLGDYIDRGESGLYVYGVISFIRSLARYRDKIIFLRGNHECYAETVYDYLVGSENKFKATFVFDAIHEIKFDIVHYDQDLKMLFSHSPLSRSLSEVMSMNLLKGNEKANIENTFTNDKENSKMEYKNIHGHTHRLSSEKVFDEFFKSDGKSKMLSLDGDASYGIQLVMNMSNIGPKKELVSHVHYLVIGENGKKHELVRREISLGDENDYNYLKFDELKNVLKRSNDYMNNQVKEFRFSDLVSVFESKFKKVFGVSPKHDNVLVKIKEGYEKAMKRRNSLNVYFDDVPVDMFIHYGWFGDEVVNNIGRLFWSIVGDEKKYEKNYLKSFVELEGVRFEKNYLKSVSNKDEKELFTSLNVNWVLTFVCFFIIIICLVVHLLQIRRRMLKIRDENSGYL